MVFGVNPILHRQPAFSMNTLLRSLPGSCRQIQGREPIGPGAPTCHLWNLRCADCSTLAHELTTSKPETVRHLGEHGLTHAQTSNPLARAFRIPPGANRLPRHCCARPHRPNAGAAIHLLSGTVLHLPEYRVRMCTTRSPTDCTVSNSPVGLPILAHMRYLRARSFNHQGIACGHSARCLVPMRHPTNGPGSLHSTTSPAPCFASEPPTPMVPATQPVLSCRAHEMLCLAMAGSKSKESGVSPSRPITQGKQRK